MALSAARGQGSLQSLTQKTRGREECDKWYDLVVDVTQEASYWSCCKTLVDLEDSEEEDEREFTYSYELPNAFLRPWYMQDFSRFSLENRFSPISGFMETRIFTNFKDARLYYAQRVTDTSRWPAAMTQAIVYGLAYKVCESLTGKDALVERLLALANGYLEQAQATSVNYGTAGRMLDSDPDWIAARGSAITAPVRYYYPFGELWAPVSGSSETSRLGTLRAASPGLT